LKRGPRRNGALGVWGRQRYHRRLNEAHSHAQLEGLVPNRRAYRCRRVTEHVHLEVSADRSFACAARVLQRGVGGLVTAFDAG
jgi:hypothetical protein